MAVEVNGETFYRTKDVCELAGISRSTLFRWIKDDGLDAKYRDKRGWRLFTGEEVDRIIDQANQVFEER